MGSGPEAAAVDYALLFQASSESLLVLRPDAPRFTMVAATDRRLEATHLTRDSLGKGLFEVFPDNPADPTATGIANLRASLERVLATRQPDTMPVQKYDIRTAGSEYRARYWSPKNIPVLSANGEVLYILHRVEDVTDLVQAGEAGDAGRGKVSGMEREVISRSRELAAVVSELRESNVRFAALDADKTAFFNNISHELRTPLALMLGILEHELTQASPALPPPTRLQLKVARRNGQRLLKLVNTLLDLSRIEAGQMPALFRPTDLAALTAELAGNFRSAVERGGLWLTVDCPPGPEPVYVDPEMWEKIVLNLLSNAFKHTFHGGITVRLTWMEDGVCLAVEDSGIGIAAADLPRVFERFHRVEGAASRTHEGSGIGLALVRELVHLHGGEIRAESEWGRGSRFTVTMKRGTAHLPAERVLAAGAASDAAPHAPAVIEEALQWLPESSTESAAAPSDEAAAPAKLSAPRARILWADDNADMRAYVTRLLSRHYDVTAVADGVAALEAARASPPDLILSDLMMPRLDGFGLLRALRADERTRRLPIILLSARAGETAAIAGLDTGADDYLVKPFSARELLARVRTHVELGWQRRAWESELERRVKVRTAQLDAELARLERLDQVMRLMTEHRDLPNLLQSVIEHIERTLPADRCWIGPPDEGAAARPQPTYVPDLTLEPKALPAALVGRGLRALVSVPITAREQLLGMLLTARLTPASFSAQDQEFLGRVSAQLAAWIQVGQLHESLQAAYDDLHLSHGAAVPAPSAGLDAAGPQADGPAEDCAASTR